MSTCSLASLRSPEKSLSPASPSLSSSTTQTPSTNSTCSPSRSPQWSDTAWWAQTRRSSTCRHLLFRMKSSRSSTQKTGCTRSLLFLLSEMMWPPKLFQRTPPPPKYSHRGQRRFRKWWMRYQEVRKNRRVYSVTIFSSSPVSISKGKTRLKTFRSRCRSFKRETLNSKRSQLKKTTEYLSLKSKSRFFWQDRSRKRENETRALRNWKLKLSTDKFTLRRNTEIYCLKRKASLRISQVQTHKWKSN